MPMTLTEADTKIAEFNKDADALLGRRLDIETEMIAAGFSKRAIGKRLASVKVNMPEGQ